MCKSIILSQNQFLILEKFLDSPDDASLQNEDEATLKYLCDSGVLEHKPIIVDTPDGWIANEFLPYKITPIGHAYVDGRRESEKRYKELRKDALFTKIISVTALVVSILTAIF